MSTREERERLGAELEQRGLVLDRPTQAAIQREAAELAQRVEQSRGAEARRRVADLLARRDRPEDG